MKGALKETLIGALLVIGLVLAVGFLGSEKQPPGAGQTFQQVFGKETGGIIPTVKARGDIMAHDDGTYSVFVHGTHAENHPGFMIIIRFRPEKDLGEVKSKGRIFFKPGEVLVGSSPLPVD